MKLMMFSVNSASFTMPFLAIRPCGLVISSTKKGFFSFAKSRA